MAQASHAPHCEANYLLRLWLVLQSHRPPIDAGYMSTCPGSVENAAAFNEWLQCESCTAALGKTMEVCKGPIRYARPLPYPDVVLHCRMTASSPDRIYRHSRFYGTLRTLTHCSSTCCRHTQQLSVSPWSPVEFQPQRQTTGSSGERNSYARSAVECCRE